MTQQQATGLDIWTFRYQGRIGLRVLTDKGRAWVCERINTPENDIVWIKETDFPIVYYDMVNDSLSIMEGDDEDIKEH